jgi:hypothetical protein
MTRRQKGKSVKRTLTERDLPLKGYKKNVFVDFWANKINLEEI